MKKLFSLLTLALLTMSAWAATDVTITFGDLYTADTALEGVSPITVDGVSLTFAKGNGTTAPKYYQNGNNARLYTGNTMKVEANSTITNIAFTYSSGTYYFEENCVDGGSYSDGAWTGSASSVTFTNNTTHQVRITKMVVTLDNGTTPPATVAAPSLPAACTFTDTYTVNITNNEEGADLYYSTDGLAWTPGNSVTINETTTVYAKATKDGIDSQVVSATYTKVSGSNTYVKVTSADQIAADNKYIVVCESKTAFMGAIGTYGASYTNNALTITDGIADIAGHDAIVELTLGGEANAWTMATGDNYIYWDNTTTNTLKTTTDNTLDGAKWIIEETASGYVLKNVDNNERVLRYNASSPRFACYTSTQTPAVLYVQDDDPTPVVPVTNEVANLQAANALNNGIEFTFTGSAVVTYQNGLYMYVKDNSGYGLIYGSVDGTFNNGDVLSANWKGIKDVYHGNNQFGSPSNVTASGTNTPVAPEVVPSLTNDKLNAYVKIEHVASIDPTNMKAVLMNGDTIVLYNRFSKTIPEFENQDCSMTGIVNVFDGTMQFYFIESDYEAPTPVAQPNDLVEANALTDNTQFTYANDVAATYQNGDYLFIRDEAGNSGLIFGTIDATFETGDVLGADWSATKDTFYGVPEFKNPAGVTNSGEKWTVEPYERQTLTTADVNAYVIMKGLSIVAETDNTVNHYDQTYYAGEDSLVLFNKFNIAFTLEEDKTYDVIGIATIFNNNPQLYIISVTEHEGTTPQPVEPEAGDYVKVTSTADLTSGEYLIVYEDGSLAFNGGLETLDAVGNTIAVEIIDNNLIKANAEADAAVFTYDAEAGTLMSASGYYIGRTSDGNGMQTSTETVYTNTLSIDENGDADIVAEGGAYLRFNSNVDQVRFRYFKSSTYTGQKAIQLYKKVEGETPAVVRGDATGEGEVNMDDLTALINYLTDNSNPINMAGAAVCDSLDSTEVNMDDLTALINFLLTNAWAN